jgi:hypothetical protein
MKKIISLLTIVLLLGSCNREKGKMELLLTKEIEECKSINCEIELKKITNFEWETVYIFQMPVPKEYINKTIGIDYIDYVEFTRPIIFINKGKIVYSENNQASVESLIPEQIIVGSLMDTTKVWVFNSNQAYFKAKVKENNHTKYYELTPIENNFQK